MAVRCSELPNLAHEEPSGLWRPFGSSSDTNPSFASCWSPVPSTAETASWYNVYHWIHSSQSSEEADSSTRSSSSSHSKSSPWDDDSSLSPPIRPFSGVATTSAKAIGATTSTWDAFPSIDTRKPHHVAPVSQIPPQQSQKSIVQPQQQHNPSTDLTPNPYASIIQELLKLNLEPAPAATVSPTSSSQTHSFGSTEVVDILRRNVPSPSQRRPPVATPASTLPSTAATTTAYSLASQQRVMPLVSPVAAPSHQTQQQSAPRPIVGQTHREEDWGNGHDKEWLTQMEAQRQQQAVYEQMYQMMLNGVPAVAGTANWTAASAPNTAPTGLPCHAALARRNSAAMELHMRLEECSEEYRQLEKERKQTEAELARHNLGKKISSSNGMPIPRLPTAPSRVDRLIVDFFREHARIVTLLGKMEQLRGESLPSSVHGSLQQMQRCVQVLQQCRHTERAAILQTLRGELVRYNEEKETLALAHALSAVRRAATRARAANWVSLAWTIGVEDARQQQVIDRLVASDFTLAPPPIKSRPVKA